MTPEDQRDNRPKDRGNSLPSFQSLTTLIATLTAFLFACDLSLAVDRPNIILILTDDQAPNMTGFEGHPLVKTPNLDRLAREGVHFTRCYTPTPQDKPSLACILTGKYPHTTGVTAEDQSLPQSTDTFTAELKRVGYACGIVGRWSLAPESTDAPGFGLVDYVATDDSTSTDSHTDKAIRFIDKFRAAPFFLWISYRAPHEPFIHPPGTEKLYPTDAIDLPPTRNLDTKKAWPGLLQARTVEPTAAFKKENDETLRHARSKYYAMITRLDENIGRLLDRLEEEGLLDNTVIVFASDNGLCLGDHALFGKGPFFYEELIRVPLLIRYPALTPPGLRIDRLVGLVDLAPTLCEVAGLEPSVLMHGKSLVRLIRDPQAPRHADERFLEYQKQDKRTYDVRGVVTRRYKFIDHLKDDDLFYDLQNDPDELNNLIKDPRYAGVVKTLQDRLKAWRKATKDPIAAR